MSEPKGDYQIITQLREQNAALVKALGDAIEALRSGAGPEEKMNAVRDGRAALIVRSVNAMPALVTALEAVESYIRQDINDCGLEMLSEEYQALWKTVETALASVRSLK